MDVVIVGASVAGVATADALRKAGHDGGITLVDADRHLPYDKPPLSKGALKPDWDARKSLLRPEQHYRDQGIELVLGQPARALDPARPMVTLDSGGEIGGDAVVIATGVRARRLPGMPPLRGVHTIRNLDDSVALRRELSGAPKLVIVGGGFIGAEVASVAVSLGADVTIVEARERPFQHLFGADVALSLARRHDKHGVRLLCGQGVARLSGEAKVEQVVLTDGTVLDADVVLLGLGAEPVVDWLAGSGVRVENGVVCDDSGRTNRRNVYAAGDVAAWWYPTARRHMRVEHWTTAKEQGTAVARAILGSSAPAPSVPYFWSDQYGSRLQFLGTSEGYDSSRVSHGSLGTDEYVVLYRKAGTVIGALGLGATRELMRCRALIGHADQGTERAIAS
ncbi:NAD(P)/FAD-dependent oxidoreductase [Amycolatopsis acidicola]|nr:FAD-dependent oxidoreductase [Amycolatopsis acidicola]